MRSSSLGYELGVTLGSGHTHPDWCVWSKIPWYLPWRTTMNQYMIHPIYVTFYIKSSLILSPFFVGMKSKLYWFDPLCFMLRTPVWSILPFMPPGNICCHIQTSLSWETIVRIRCKRTCFGVSDFSSPFAARSSTFYTIYKMSFQLLHVSPIAVI